MRRCPSCGYSGPGSPERCAVCGADLSGIEAAPDEKPRKRYPVLMIAAGLALLGCAAYIYFTGRRDGAPRPSSEAPVKPGPGGALRSLEKMSALRFLPDGDKLGVLPLLLSPDGKVSRAAARAAGGWIRSGGPGSVEKRLFEGLLEAADSAVPAGRGQAAREAGLSAALGFPSGAYSGKISGISGRLAGEASPELMGAGFFLSSMTGSRELEGKMREVLAGAGGEEARLYAACALSRLNDTGGNKFLEKAASGPCSALKSEALYCLGYSASPRAVPLLEGAVSEGAQECAESAKIALILRRQLAIIKK